MCGAPGEIRTPGLLVRSQTLYPTELRAHYRDNERVTALADLGLLQTLANVVNEAHFCTFCRRRKPPEKETAATKTPGHTVVRATTTRTAGVLV